MEMASFDRSLRTFVRRKPFHPFKVELTSGSQIEVDHPEALMVRNGVAVYFAPDGEIILFDHDTVARLSSNGKGNGTAGMTDDT